MNPQLEMADETTAEPELVVDLPEDVIQTFINPETFSQQLQVLSTKAVTLVPTDALSVKQCAAFVETCTVASRYAEKRRHELIDEHNKIVKDANAVWMPIVDGFAAIAKRKSGEVAQWVTLERRKAEEAQRKKIADKKAKQDELDRKAQQERDEAERLRVQAEQAETPEEQAALTKQATQLDTKAEKHELAASNVVTTVIPQQAKTVDLGGSKLVTKAPKKTYLLAGWDRAKPLRLTDPKLSALIGDIEKLPEGLKFLIQHSELSPVLLNKSFGVIKFPAPFAEVDDFGGSSIRMKG